MLEKIRDNTYKQDKQIPNVGHVLYVFILDLSTTNTGYV